MRRCSSRTSVISRRAGTPMSWWWDNYVDPQNLYPIYAAFNGWIEGFDFIAQEARSMRADVDTC